MNGKRKGKSFVDGDTVEFSCDENFSLSGSSISRCLGGRWSVALPECKGYKMLYHLFISYLMLNYSDNKNTLKKVC